jgi:hypothetical protein
MGAEDVVDYPPSFIGWFVLIDSLDVVKGPALVQDDVERQHPRLAAVVD